MHELPSKTLSPVYVYVCVLPFIWYQLKSNNNKFCIFIHGFCLFQLNALQNFYAGDRNRYNLCHNLRQFIGCGYFYRDIKSENSLS